MANDGSPLVKMLFFGYKNGTYTICGTYRWLEDPDAYPRMFQRLSLNIDGSLSVGQGPGTSTDRIEGVRMAPSTEDESEFEDVTPGGAVSHGLKQA